MRQSGTWVPRLDQQCQASIQSPANMWPLANFMASLFPHELVHVRRGWKYLPKQQPLPPVLLLLLLSLANQFS